MDEEPRWYCIRSQVKREHIAAAHLRDRGGYEVYCPRVNRVRSARGGKRRYTDALFPGYLFGRFSLHHDFRNVSYSTGVQRIVQLGARVPVVEERFIESLRRELQGELYVEPEADLVAGESVSVVTGPLKDFIGTVVRLEKSEQRVSLLLDFLGRELEVTVPRESVLCSGNSAPMMAG